jgi:hypothetical protein
LLGRGFFLVLSIGAYWQSKVDHKSSFLFFEPRYQGESLSYWVLHLFPTIKADASMALPRKPYFILELTLCHFSWIGYPDQNRGFIVREQLNAKGTRLRHLRFWGRLQSRRFRD